MKKNNLWLLDAHCDSFEMRRFLDDDLDLIKSKHTLSVTTCNMLTQTFKINVPEGTVIKYHATFTRFQKGNVRAVFLMCGDLDLIESSLMIDAAYKMANLHSDKAVICYNRDDAQKAAQAGKLAVFLIVEGASMFHNQLDLLRNWHRLGVRVMNLTHGEGTAGLTDSISIKLANKDKGKNVQYGALQITPSCEGILSKASRSKLYKKERGLSKFGKLAIQEMTKLGMLCDLSHASDATFWEVLNSSSGKVCVTHSNCATLCGQARNLTDEMMKALAEHGGVMGLCFYGAFIDEKKPSLERYVEHILHALSIMSEDHVGIGSDYDGVEPGTFMAVPNPSRMNSLWEALDKAGVKHKTMLKIAHENFLRLLS